MKSKKRNGLESRADGVYGYRCDFCDGGRVRHVIREREFIRVTKTDYVALESVPIGVCDKCSMRYYSAHVLRCAAELHRKGARRQVKVPVARYVQVG